MDRITRRLPGLTLTDMTFEVPLDHARPDGPTIEVYARALAVPQSPGEPVPEKPWLVYFQGGPGFAAPRPTGASGWIKRALQDYRVLLLDERGTGRSTPLTAQTLRNLPSAQAQADYIRCFRADSIVKDAEFIRRALLGDEVRWTAMGQSFGGFCVTHYLSAAPNSLTAAVITGGVAPIKAGPDEIYRRLYPRVADRNRRYYERYPDDAGRTTEIVSYLSTHDVRLPSGGKLTPRRFQQLGMEFGANDGFEQVHYLLEEAFVRGPDGPELGFAFLRHFENALSFDTNPIYALLHEAEYCQGEASNWSAERLRAEFPEFALQPVQPVYFTGEMVYPWMFEEYEQLRPLQQAAEILARYEAWPALYDLDVLRRNSVPVAATVYYDDMYVERTLSEEAAREIKGIRLWITNEYEHNGLRADGERVLGQLLDMLK